MACVNSPTMVFLPSCQIFYPFKSVVTGNRLQVKVTQLKFQSSKSIPVLIGNI